MLAVAAAIAAPSPQAAPSRPLGATVRATASVRILSGATISWSAASTAQPRMRLGQLRETAGSAAQPIRLVEFE